MISFKPTKIYPPQKYLKLTQRNTLFNEGGRWRKYTPVINSFNINSHTFDTKPIILGQKFGEKKFLNKNCP